MSFSADIEHIFTPVETLPETIRGVFAAGCCAVWSTPAEGEPELTAAIPANNDQTNELADLMEIAAIGLSGNDPAFIAYCKLRDELCAPLGYQRTSFLFKQEMEKQYEREEVAQNAKYLKLASAARAKKSELN